MKKRGSRVDGFGWFARGSDVAVLRNTLEDKTPGGIVLLDSRDREPPLVGKVISVGPDVLDLELGDVVIFSRYSGAEVEVEFEGRKVFMLPEKNVKLVQGG